MPVASSSQHQGYIGKSRRQESDVGSMREIFSPLQLMDYLTGLNVVSSQKQLNRKNAKLIWNIKNPLLTDIAAVYMGFLILCVVLREREGCKWILPVWETQQPSLWWGEQHWAAGVNKLDLDFPWLFKTKMLRNVGVSGALTCFTNEVQKKGWTVGFPNVTGRLHFTCFETVEGKATKSRQTSDGGRRAFGIRSPKGPEKNCKCSLPGIRWAREGWMNMIILVQKELLRDYNPLQRQALRMESQGRVGESWFQKWAQTIEIRMLA